MLVGMLVGGGVISVVHARTEVRVVEDLVLMIEAQSVADLLAHHKVSPGGRVVLWGVEIRIIHLGGALRDVLAANPDLRESQPSVVAVGAVADLYPPTRRTAVLGVGTPCGDRRVQHRGLTPVGGGGPQ